MLSSYLMPAMLLASFLFLGHSPSSVEALTCPRCLPDFKATACQDLTETDCPNGVTTDMCGCCDACYKGLDEQCGGIWNHGGFCADAYSCSPNPRSKQLPGICVPKTSSK